MTASRVGLSRIEQLLDETFDVTKLGVDATFSRFVPEVYGPIGFDWSGFFEPEFCVRFNGVMIRGDLAVAKVWCISFPTEEVLGRILVHAQPVDLIFAHHPINMECGDPRGKPGRGFLPIPIDLLRTIKERRVSYYSCHVPLDTKPGLSTSDAIVHLIGGKVVGQFLSQQVGFAGRLCDTPPRSAHELVVLCKRALGLLFVDLQGDWHKTDITRIAVVAGGGGSVTFYQEADRLGADCLIAGEVTSKIDNDLGRERQTEIEKHLRSTKLAAIGLSHAGSEFLVMRELVPFFQDRLQLAAEAVPETNWWR